MQNNRNVYHIHGLLVANESQKPFIINKDELLDLWTEKKGGILDVRNGETIAVLHKYLTPHKNNSNNEWAIKMNIKAENLEKIPYKARIYSPSTGIIRPVCILLTIEEALEIVKDLIEFYPRYKIDYFPSSFNDGYAANEIERRIFEISQEAELKDMLIKKIVEFAKRKKKSKIKNDYNQI